MKHFVILTSLVTSSMLMGCTTTPPTPKTLSAEQTSYLDTPIYCDIESCDDMWERSVEYVSIASGYRLKTHTSNEISYETPGGASFGMKIMKFKLDNVRSKIEVSTWCDSAYGGCFANPYEVKAMAKAYILRK